MIEVLPVFSVRPDWATPVRESMEWKTNIMRSQATVEQRVATRLTARRRQEVPITAIDEDHGYYQNLMSVEPQGRYYVPLWFERARTDADALTGATTIVMGGIRREFLQTQFVFLQGPKPWMQEVAEVASAASGAGEVTLTLASPLANDWVLGTPIYPCYSAIIESADATQFTRQGARVLQGSVKFLFDKPFDWTSALTPPTYASQPVFELLTNEGGQQSGDFSRVLGNHDGGVGVVTQIDLGGKALPGFMSNNWVQGRANNELLRDFVYYMRGRQRHGWWVHPMDDIVLAQPIGTANTFLDVKRSGVADLGITSSREYIRVMLRDGTSFYRHLTGVAIVDNATERLTIDTALGADIGVETVSTIRYISQGRLDQDLISFDHHTDQDGITEYNLGVRFVPEIRISTDWSPPALPDTTAHDETCLVLDGDHNLGPP